MAEGFFSRWSQRKEAVRQGREVAPEPQRPVEVPAPVAAPAPVEAPAVADASLAEVPPPPTLEDAQALTGESDFTRFVQPGVAPEVRTAALKKLFTDPHFNVMDGLDVYIDDYNKPDPLSPEIAKQLASSRFLSLFEEKEQRPEGESPTPSASPDAAGPESVAQSGTRTVQALPPADDHADPDLRLQQDDAPGPEGPGAGPR